jgi:hypothetical protein
VIAAVKEKVLKTRAKAGAKKSPRQESPESPARPPENLRPAPKAWQKVVFLICAIALAGWLIALLLMAWK